MSVAAIAVLVAGGCGSAASTDTSARPSPKLSLAKASARTGAADSAAPSAMPFRLTNYVLDGTLPDLGRQALVYRWTGHAVDFAEANRLADALGIDAAPYATPDGFTASDPDATITITTTYGPTQISYSPGVPAVDGSAGGSSGASSPPSAGTGVAPDDPNSSTVNEKPVAIDEPVPTDPGVTELPPKLTPPVDVPNASDAEDIARTVLDRMGVLDGAQWDTEVHDSSGIAVTCVVGEDCSGTPQQVTARDVSFSLVLDGVKVSGIGWNVTVGEHRSIQSVYGEWGSAVVLGTYDLRSTADAFDSLQNGDANYGGREPMAVDDTPVKAQVEPNTAVTEPAVAPPVEKPTGREPGVDPSGGDDPVVDTPLPTEPLPIEPEPEPVDVHVTGVSLGLARWDAVDGNRNVVDLVPTYVFHTVLDGVSSDVEELALDPAAIDFADPIPRGAPVPQPGAPTPEPQPAPVPDASGGVKSTPAS
jgi:hypothetical protein